MFECDEAGNLVVVWSRVAGLYLYIYIYKFLRVVWGEFSVPCGLVYYVVVVKSIECTYYDT